MKPVLQAKEFEGYFWIPAHIHVEEVTKAYKAGAAEEREACAKACDIEANDLDERDSWNNCASYLSKQIRGRGQHD